MEIFYNIFVVIRFNPIFPYSCPWMYHSMVSQRFQCLKQSIHFLVYSILIKSLMQFH